jgi:hypothetical protein
MSAELSGRVTTLENQMSFVAQDLLQRIDLVAASSQAVSWNQQFDLIDRNLTTIKNQLQTLQSLYTNLFITVQNHYNTFTGHTGNSSIHV